MKSVSKGRRLALQKAFQTAGDLLVSVLGLEANLLRVADLAQAST